MKSLRKRVHFTVTELRRLEVAVRLRAEACEENIDEREADAKEWRALQAKLDGAIESVVGGGS